MQTITLLLALTILTACKPPLHRQSTPSVKVEDAVTDSSPASQAAPKSSEVPTPSVIDPTSETITPSPSVGPPEQNSIASKPSYVLSRGFYTQDGALYTATGKRFTLRGVSVPFIWWFAPSLSAIPHIASHGFNTIRLVWESSGSADDLKTAIRGIVENKMIPMLELHDATGSNDSAKLASLINYYLRKDIKPILLENEKVLLINLANEWGDNSLANAAWKEAYEKSIANMRAGGLNHTLVIDASGWGQNKSPILQFAGSLTAADPLHNLLFSVHMYGGSWNDKNEFSNFLGQVSSMKLPLIVGEFGYDYNSGNNNLGCRVDAPELLLQADRFGIGLLAWSWKGNNDENAWLDLSHDWEGTDLTSWGDLILGGKDGIKATSIPADVF